MFARTERLLLRPGWREDAPALHAAVADFDIVRMTGRMPWPYTAADAEAFLTLPPDRELRLLIFARTDAAPLLAGGIGLLPDAAGGVELGYWIARACWGRGYATEAGRAVLAMASTLGHRRLVAGHFADNPASGRVLTKLGFVATGQVIPRHSRARDAIVPTAMYAYGAAEAASLAA